MWLLDERYRCNVLQQRARCAPARSKQCLLPMSLENFVVTRPRRWRLFVLWTVGYPVQVSLWAIFTWWALPKLAAFVDQLFDFALFMVLWVVGSLQSLPGQRSSQQLDEEVHQLTYGYAIYLFILLVPVLVEYTLADPEAPWRNSGPKHLAHLTVWFTMGVLLLRPLLRPLSGDADQKRST